MKRLMTCLFVTLWCALETACFGGLTPPVPVTSPNSDDEQPPVVDERARVELADGLWSLPSSASTTAPIVAAESATVGGFGDETDSGHTTGDDAGRSGIHGEAGGLDLVLIL